MCRGRFGARPGPGPCLILLVVGIGVDGHGHTPERVAHGLQSAHRLTDLQEYEFTRVAAMLPMTPAPGRGPRRTSTRPTPQAPNQNPGRAV